MWQCKHCRQFSSDPHKSNDCVSILLGRLEKAEKNPVDLESLLKNNKSKIKEMLDQELVTRLELAEAEVNRLNHWAKPLMEKAKSEKVRANEAEAECKKLKAEIERLKLGYDHADGIYN